MNCREVQKRLAEDSSWRFEESFSDHLVNCPECRTHCEDLLELEDLARSLGDRCRVPSDFKSEILEKVADVKSPFAFLSPFRVLAACLVLLVVSVGFFSTWEESEQVDEPVKLDPFESVVFDGDFGLESSDEQPTYIEITVDDPVNGELILRLPSEIVIRQTELHEDFYLHQVSH
ncbi:MAG: hypothetical protein JSU96_18840 [Acidobacteriota bacterium]|nr:MAG: hypothetical protein JSU96_18840 [Acidobacteriota bacterium]